MQHAMQTDHLIIAVRDLDEAQAAYQRLGFTLTDRKSFTDDAEGLGNHLVYLSGIYLELMGNLEEGHATALSPVIALREGLAGIAVICADVAGESARAQAMGFHSEMRQFEVHFEAAGKRYDGRFRVTRLTQSALKTTWVQILEELVPYDRTPFYLPHANGAQRVTKTVFAVKDADDNRLLTTLLGNRDGAANGQASQWQDDAQAFTLIGLDEAEATYGALPAHADTGAAIPYAIHLAVEDLERAAGVLRSNDIPFERKPSSLVIPAAACCGTALVFEA